MEKLVKLKALVPFNRNLGGQMVVGHPEHPDEEHQFLYLSAGDAKVLIDEKLAKKISTVDAQEPDLAPPASHDVAAAKTAGEQGSGRRRGQPAGGSTTNAAVHHPATNADGSPSNIPGAVNAQEPDAAP